MHIEIDVILAEFQGSLADVVPPLGLLLGHFKKRYRLKEDPWWESSEAGEMYEEYCVEFRTYTPEGYYFGGHPTHSQCIGYWKNELPKS